MHLSVTYNNYFNNAELLQDIINVNLFRDMSLSAWNIIFNTQYSLMDSNNFSVKLCHTYCKKLKAKVILQVKYRL